MSTEVSEEEKKKIEEMVDNLVKRAKVASEEYLKLDQDQVDEIVKQMAMAGLEHHMELAKMAVEETGRGIYEDKITKNMFSTEYIYHSIKYDKTVGVISESEEEGYEEIVEKKLNDIPNLEEEKQEKLQACEDAKMLNHTINEHPIMMIGT